MASHPPPAAPATPPASSPSLAEVRRWHPALAIAYDARAVRGSVFGRVALTDAGWDIMLFMALAACDQREVTVGDACQSAHTSASTALRQLDYLCDRKLLVRVPNPADRRSHLVAITPTGLAKLIAYLDRLSGASAWSTPLAASIVLA